MRRSEPWPERPGAEGAESGEACRRWRGCGSSGSYKNAPRPPSPIVITAAIVPHQVSVSPRRFGAGPITLIVTNETSASQQLTLRSRSGSVHAPSGLS